MREAPRDQVNSEGKARTGISFLAQLSSHGPAEQPGVLQTGRAAPGRCTGEPLCQARGAGHGSTAAMRLCHAFLRGHADCEL